jgi:peptidoglycan/LPS O-acetylase OafA/YrhL
VQARRLPPLFAERRAGTQLMLALVVPAAFGAIVGLVLGVSATAYWGLQALAAVGGLLAGLEHRDGVDGADRGLFGGLLFGTFLLLAHAISGADAKVDLGQWPGALIVFAGLAGCLLGALGGSGRAALERRG